MGASLIIAIYGKGGIGKSTIASYLSALLALRGRRVLQVGCDPKHDSTYLLSGRFIKTVVEVLIEKKFDINRVGMKDIIFPGRFGTGLIEVGGPEAGKGCGGYAIGETMEILERLGIFKDYDYVFLDVLGDIVCGGFAVPMKLAHLVYVIASNDFDSLFAANRINSAIVEKGKHYPLRLGGIIGNKCSGDSSLKEFCLLSRVPLIATIPFSPSLHRARQKGEMLFELKECQELVSRFEKIAMHIEERPLGVIPQVIPEDRFFDLFFEEWEGAKDRK